MLVALSILAPNRLPETRFMRSLLRIGHGRTVLNGIPYIKPLEAQRGWVRASPEFLDLTLCCDENSCRALLRKQIKSQSCLQLLAFQRAREVINASKSRLLCAPESRARTMNSTGAIKYGFSKTCLRSDGQMIKRWYKNCFICCFWRFREVAICLLWARVFCEEINCSKMLLTCDTHALIWNCILRKSRFLLLCAVSIWKHPTRASKYTARVYKLFASLF